MRQNITAAAPSPRMPSAPEMKSSQSMDAVETAGPETDGAPVESVCGDAAELCCSDDGNDDGGGGEARALSDRLGVGCETSGGGGDVTGVGGDGGGGEESACGSHQPGQSQSPSSLQFGFLGLHIAKFRPGGRL